MRQMREGVPHACKGAVGSCAGRACTRARVDLSVLGGLWRWGGGEGRRICGGGEARGVAAGVLLRGGDVGGWVDAGGGWECACRVGGLPPPPSSALRRWG